MTTVTPYIERHRPLLTPRIEFKLAPLPPLPSITSRIEFTPERLARVQKGKGRAVNQRARFGSVSGNDGDELQPVPGSSNSRDRSPRITSSNMIPKPSGEPGRPGSGGFSVDEVLMETHNWSKESVDKLMVRKLCDYNMV